MRKYLGLGEYVYLTHYADDANGSDTPYHELAHCLGYGHSGNMTYYPAEGGFSNLYEGLLTAFREQEFTGLFPPFLHTRRNKNLVENKTCILPRKYIIDDPNWMP